MNCRHCLSSESHLSWGWDHFFVPPCGCTSTHHCHNSCPSCRIQSLHLSFPLTWGFSGCCQCPDWSLSNSNQPHRTTQTSWRICSSSHSTSNWLSCFCTCGSNSYSPVPVGLNSSNHRHCVHLGAGSSLRSCCHPLTVVPRCPVRAVHRALSRCHSNSGFRCCSASWGVRRLKTRPRSF